MDKNEWQALESHIDPCAGFLKISNYSMDSELIPGLSNISEDSIGRINYCFFQCFSNNPKQILTQMLIGMSLGIIGWLLQVHYSQNTLPS